MFDTTDAAVTAAHDARTLHVGDILCTHGKYPTFYRVEKLNGDWATVQQLDTMESKRGHGTEWQMVTRPLRNTPVGKPSRRKTGNGLGGAPYCVKVESGAWGRSAYRWDGQSVVNSHSALD